MPHLPGYLLRTHDRVCLYELNDTPTFSLLWRVFFFNLFMNFLLLLIPSVSLYKINPKISPLSEADYEIRLFLRVFVVLFWRTFFLCTLPALVSSLLWSYNFVAVHVHTKAAPKFTDKVMREAFSMFMGGQALGSKAIPILLTFYGTSFRSDVMFLA